MNNGKLIYLYCITDKEPVLDKASKLIDNLYSINSNGIYAIISEVSEIEFEKENLNKNIADMEWLEKHVRIHESVIDAILTEKQLALVPFKFATVFYNTDTIDSFIADYSESLKKNLLYLSDKEEWGLKIFCNTKMFIESVYKQSSEIIELDNEIKSSKPGKAYILKKKKKDLANVVMSKELNIKRTTFFNKLEKISEQGKVNKNQVKELTGKDDDMVLNAVFLLTKEKIQLFIETIMEFEIENSIKGLNFEYTGPWPPYNFCNIEKIT